MTPEEEKLEFGGSASAEVVEHVHTYQSFVRAMTYVAFAFPAFFAFVLYWTV